MTSLAFVSAPGGSAFMAELLMVVADAVTRSGGQATCIEGTISDAEADAYVVVPHEYFVLTGEHDPALLARTIGFGVEHPGTATFTAMASASSMLGGNVAISADAVTEMQRRGIPAQRFELGLSSVWDRRDDVTDRDIDLVYLGTADERRLRVLAKVLPGLADRRTEVLLPPHEPMTRPRPDFLMGADKWQLLARSRLLLNLHREGSTAFEWVRALEAISNDCAILTSPSTGLAPLIPGEHVLVGELSRLGDVAIAALDDKSLLERIASQARARCEAELDMAASASRLVDLASSLGSAPVEPVAPVQLAPVGDEPSMAGWLPMVPAPVTSGEVAHLQVDGKVDVVVRAGVGPLSLTLASIGDADRDAHGSAPYVLVLDSGDEVLGATLDRMVAVLDDDPAIDVAFPLAVLGSELVVNAMVPEVRRLNAMPYLSRGYLVRRSWLDENDLGEDDHNFWLRVAESGVGVEHIRSVGIRLWSQA